jgi:acyl carrier protein
MITVPTTTSKEQIQTTIFNILGTIAPEANLADLDPDVNMQRALDIDSFDFLNLLIGLDEAMGVEIPEADYGQLVSLNDLINYLAARL